MSNYSPLNSALSAAVSELTSPQAKVYYVHRAQQDVFTLIALVVGMSCFAYELGSQFRAWTNELEVGAIAQPEVTKIAGLLAPAQTVKTKKSAKPKAKKAPRAKAGVTPNPAALVVSRKPIR
jgi:hypothetical protein